MKCELLFLLGLCVHLASQNTVWAEEEKTPDQKQVAAILQRWEAASNRVDALDVRFKRFERSSGIGEIEKHGSGRFVWERSGRFVYDLKHMKLRSDVANSRNTSTKKQYRLIPWDSETFYWDGDSFYWIHDYFKSYKRFSLPLSVQEESDIGSLKQMLGYPPRIFHLVVDVQADQLLERYAWSLKSHKDDEIHLSAKRRTRVIFWNPRRHLGIISRIEVTLDAKSLRTKTVKVINHGGNSSVVHDFAESEANPGAVSWQPDLTEYKQILPPN